MLLKEWRGKCYSDINKIEEDLKWLSSQGFIGMKKDKPIRPPEPNENTSLNLGGWFFSGRRSFYKSHDADKIYSSKSS